MASYLLEWLQILLRFLHVITGIAWIGASFYFVWLDNHLQKPKSTDLIHKGVDGELWAVHGGGFYNPQKYLVAPSTLPPNLHWFYWESYSTWMSGFALFVFYYLTNAQTMMLDPHVSTISPIFSVVISLALLIAGWLIYDFLCRFFQKKEGLLGLAVSLMIIGMSWVTCHLFAARAAFLLTGAVMATIMTANVFFWIIPGQKTVLKSMQAGEPVDAIHGIRGKQRSVHNTYFTLPVLFAMMSNHFHMIYSHKFQWILLVLMMLAGVLIRHYFVLRHKSKQQWRYIIISCLLILGVAVAAAPPTASNSGAPIPEISSVSYNDIEPIIQSRCVPCHSAEPLMVPVAPKNIKFDSKSDIEAQAQLIYLQAVQLKTMPIGNITEMKSEERDILKKWYESR